MHLAAALQHVRGMAMGVRAAAAASAARAEAAVGAVVARKAKAWPWDPLALACSIRSWRR